MAIFSSLSQEIYDYIVDVEAADLQYLKTCSRTHPSLRDRAQKILFNEVTVRSSSRVKELLGLIQHNRNIPKYISVVSTRSAQLVDVAGPLKTLLELLNETMPPSPIEIRLGSGCSENDPAGKCTMPIDTMKNICSRITKLQLNAVDNFPVTVLSSCSSLEVLLICESTLSLNNFGTKSNSMPTIASQHLRPRLLRFSSCRRSGVHVAALRNDVIDLSQLHRYDCMYAIHDWTPCVDGIQLVLDTSQAFLTEFRQHTLLKPGADHTHIYSLQQMNNIRFLALESTSLGDIHCTESIFHLTSILRGINPTLNILEKISFTVQIELDSRLVEDTGTLAPLVETLPALLVDPAALTEWRAFFRLLATVACGRKLDVVLRIEGGLRPESRTIYPDASRVTDGKVFATHVQRWLEDRNTCPGVSRVTITCDADVVFITEEVYYADADWAPPEDEEVVEVEEDEDEDDVETEDEDEEDEEMEEEDEEDEDMKEDADNELV